jgi:hypothetical protein
MIKNKKVEKEIALAFVEKLRTIKLIEDVLKRHGLIQTDFTFETIEDEVAKYRLKYQVYGERIDVFNMFFVTIKDNTEIRVREHKYRECNFDTDKEGCYSMLTIQEFKDYLKKYN